MINYEDYGVDIYEFDEDFEGTEDEAIHTGHYHYLKPSTVKKPA